VEGGGKAFDEWDYIQIVVVIEDEVGDYQNFGPKNAISAGRFAIFALPHEAKVCHAELCVMSSLLISSLTPIIYPPLFFH